MILNCKKFLRRKTSNVYTRTTGIRMPSSTAVLTQEESDNTVASYVVLLIVINNITKLQYTDT